MSYQKQCNLLNSNSIRIAINVQYKVEISFKEIVLDGSLGKTKYYALRIESHERVSLQWTFNSPNIQDETAYTNFIENTVNAQLPESENAPDLLELAKPYQIHSHSRI